MEGSAPLRAPSVMVVVVRAVQQIGRYRWLKRPDVSRQVHRPGDVQRWLARDAAARIAVVRQSVRGAGRRQRRKEATVIEEAAALKE